MYMKEATKRMRLGTDNLPSVCFYSFLNAYQVSNHNKLLLVCVYAPQQLTDGRTDTNVNYTNHCFSLTSAGSDCSGLHWRLQPDCWRLCWLHSTSVERHAEEAPQGQVCSRYIIWPGATTSLIIARRYLIKNFYFSSSDLNLIDKESDDVLERIMDEKTASESKILYGHSGPVYGISFSPDR